MRANFFRYHQNRCPHTLPVFEYRISTNCSISFTRGNSGKCNPRCHSPGENSPKKLANYQVFCDKNHSKGTCEIIEIGVQIVIFEFLASERKSIVAILTKPLSFRRTELYKRATHILPSLNCMIIMSYKNWIQIENCFFWPPVAINIIFLLKNFFIYKLYFW